MSSSMGVPLGHIDTTCGSLLRELQSIWDEVGEDDRERDKMLLRLEQDCLSVYRRKVEEANGHRLELQQALVDMQTEMAALCAVMGDHYAPVLAEEEWASTLMGQVAVLEPMLAELRERKGERALQFADVSARLASLRAELELYGDDALVKEHLEEETERQLANDLTTAYLTELQDRLSQLQAEKDERLRSMGEELQAIYRLCSLMGAPYEPLVSGVHPSLVDASSGAARCVGAAVMAKLRELHVALQEQRRDRLQQVAALVEKLQVLWKLLQTPPEQQNALQHLVHLARAPEDDLIGDGLLTDVVISAGEAEVERLQREKGSKMKELVALKRQELEQVSQRCHLEPPRDTAPEVTDPLIDAGVIDLEQLMEQLDAQIRRVLEEEEDRAGILKEYFRWARAGAEEAWLHSFEQDASRYESKKLGAHSNMNRAEKARKLVKELPQVVEKLETKVQAWEREHHIVFLIHGKRLLDTIEDDNAQRRAREEEKIAQLERKHAEKKKQMADEARFGAAPPPRSHRASSPAVSPAPPLRRASLAGGGAGFASPMSASKVPDRRLSVAGGPGGAHAHVEVGSQSADRRQRQNGPLFGPARNAAPPAAAAAGKCGVPLPSGAARGGGGGARGATGRKEAVPHRPRPSAPMNMVALARDMGAGGSPQPPPPARWHASEVSAGSSEEWESSRRGSSVALPPLSSYVAAASSASQGGGRGRTAGVQMSTSSPESSDTEDSYASSSFYYDDSENIPPHVPVSTQEKRINRQLGFY